MATTAEERFMQEQDFGQEEAGRLRAHFRALLFQPSIVGPTMVIAIIFQSRALFFLLATILVWNVAFPRLNPFERFYDWVIGRKKGQEKLEPIPIPCRFAQGMAAAFMLAAGLALCLGGRPTAYVFEIFLVVAFTALVGGKFCLGANAFPLLRRADGVRQPHVSVVQSLGIVAGCRSHPRSGGRRTALKSRRFAVMARAAAS
jgi:hypothetical protein